jgi:hypothetical protein
MSVRLSILIVFFVLQIIGHSSRQAMPSLHLSTKVFLDGVKQGWAVKYGPTLQALGLDDLGIVQDLTEVDLKEQLGSPLRAAGVPSLHVAQIVKQVHLINSKQGSTTNPNRYPHLTTITLCTNL